MTNAVLGLCCPNDTDGASIKAVVASRTAQLVVFI